ncbi:hypothetical protein Y032_0087g2101 [Ancylostoma ceylanicum]|uniref:Uncharacterized protein n=1 Tax=Ancylostoma ceylanicum TaxID=53326 RepID=A0A016TPQ3_9BILA|nr:hypothetical protein Y032_0087g2101 [Ancylostoma ceylanicum]
MASASTSSESCSPDEELVRDAALCLRSFHGTKDFIPYSKFCERFKKNSGYSIKEFLQNCEYTFADVMEKVSKTTRTKCEYDAEQKMIKLIPEKTSISGNQLIFSAPANLTGFPIFHPRSPFIPLHTLNPYAPAFVPQPQMVMLPRAPFIAGSHPAITVGGVPTFHQMCPATPPMTPVLSANPDCPIGSAITNDGDDPEIAASVQVFDSEFGCQ